MNVKRIYILLVAAVMIFLTAGQLRAQHYVGARMGIGSGTVRFYPSVETGSVVGLFSGGVSWKYYSPERFIGGVQADLMFMQQGYEELEYNYTENHTYQRKINSIMLPVMWQPHAYFARRRVRAFLNLGVTLSYNLSSTFKETQPDGTVIKGDYKTTPSKDNTMAYGAVGGLGIGWLSDRWEFFGEFRYYLGFGDLYRNRTKYQVPDGQRQNPLRSPLDGMQFSVGVYYRLGQGGILSLPASSVAAKLETMEAVRSMDAELENLGIPLTKKDERRLRRSERQAEKQRRRNQSATEQMQENQTIEESIDVLEEQRLEGGDSETQQTISQEEEAVYEDGR